jgi:hypothetical protein
MADAFPSVSFEGRVFFDGRPSFARAPFEDGPLTSKRGSAGPCEPALRNRQNGDDPEPCQLALAPDPDELTKGKERLGIVAAKYHRVGCGPTMTSGSTLSERFVRPPIEACSELTPANNWDSAGS